MTNIASSIDPEISALMKEATSPLTSFANSFYKEMGESMKDISISVSPITHMAETADAIGNL